MEHIHCKSTHANQQQRQHLEFQRAKVLPVVRNSREARRSFLTPAMMELWLVVVAYIAKQRVLGKWVPDDFKLHVYIYIIYIVRLHDSDSLPEGHPTSNLSKVLTVLFRCFSQPQGYKTLIFHCRNLPSSSKCHWSADAANSLDHQ